MKYTLHQLVDQKPTFKEYADKSGALRAARKLNLEEVVLDSQILFKKDAEILAAVVPDGMTFTFVAVSPTNVTERIISEFYKAFDHFNKELCPKALPHPVITLIPAGRRNAMGWHAANRWKKGEFSLTEINMCTEFLQRPIEDVLETLIHEMVHMSNKQDGIRDCNDQQRHNKKFMARCEVMGLTCEKMGRFGFAKTGLGEKAKASVASCPIDRSVFDLARNMVVKRKKGVKVTGIILDDGMKANLDIILKAFPFLVNRSAGRYALAMMADLANQVTISPAETFCVSSERFPMAAK